MGVVSFRYFLCDDFPAMATHESLGTSVQASMPWGDDTAETRITKLGLAKAHEFERFRVLHQVEREIDAIYEHSHIKRVLQNQKFEAFYNRRDHYFLLKCDKKDGKGVFERLRKLDPPVIALPGSVDLKSIIATYGKVTGAYFGNLRIDKVRGAALFGDTTVVESEEFEHYSQLGDLSAVYMRLVADDDGSVRSLQLMMDRSVVLHQDWGDKENLEFILGLQNKLTELGGP